MDERSSLANNPASPSVYLVEAVRHLLRPLVRLFVRNQITFPYISNLLKEVYVRVVEEEFPVAGKRQTNSRISLLSGVHRKDVKRIREATNEELPPPAHVSLGSQLISHWLGEPRYLDNEGRPRPLPRHPRPDIPISFEGLVTSVSKDIRPRAVLDEWLRLGVAHLDDEDNVWLNTAAFVPEKGFEEKVFFLGQNLHDHIAACAYNVSNEGIPFFERSVYFDGLTKAEVEELRGFSQQLGM